MKCIHSYRTHQDECHCTATYSHHGGGGIGGGINGGTPDLGNILAGQTVRIIYEYASNRTSSSKSFLKSKLVLSSLVHF